MRKKVRIPLCRQCISYAICRSAIIESIDCSSYNTTSVIFHKILSSIHKVENKCKDLHLYIYNISYRSFDKSKLESNRVVVLAIQQQYSLYGICKIMCILPLFDISTECVPKEFRDAYNSVYNRVG